MPKISKIIFLLITLFFCGNFLINNNFILANSGETNYIIISEIQIGGESAYDEFVELYNPTDDTINLENWDLKRKTKSGTEYSILNNIEGIIPARGYFLIVPRANCGENKDELCYLKEMAGDDEYTTNSFLARNNTILLYDDGEDLVDKVGWGEASDFEGEVISINPKNGESLERKNINNIAQDTDNNNDDFVLATIPSPQNSFVSVDDDNSDEQDGSSQETGANDDQETGASDDSDNNQDDSQDDLGQEGEIDTSAYKIVITEFLPNPEDSDRDNEFIEIYNAGEIKADLSGWTLEDKMGRIKTFEIKEKAEIKAGGYKAFYSDETRIALNNSGDGVVLRNNKGDIIDETLVSNSAKENRAYALNKSGNWVWTLRPTAGRKNIIKEEKKISDDKQDDSSQEIKDSDRQEGSSQETGANDADDADDDNNKEDETDKNNTEENIVYNFSDEIVISEIYPNPEGRDNRDGNYEWIELYNCSPQDVNLIGWQIDDILRKGSKSYTIKENKIIKAKSQLIFTNEETKVIFNNSGDEVNLLWSDGTVVDSVSYGKSAEGQSYNWINGNWSWSKTITPNKNNLADITGKILSAESVANSNNEDEIEIEIDESDMDIEEDLISEIEYTEITIIEAKKLPRFSEVKITGVVSTPPGIFSDDIFYITGSGIQIYGKNIDISKINIGDEIKIAGQISEVGGEKRILLNKAENIKIISSDNLVESRVISIADVGEDNEGYLVTIEGKVAEIKNDVFFLSDKNERIKIYLKPQAGIEKSRIEINKWMAITGQVSRTSAGYRILPRFQADLKFGRVSGIAMASADLIGQENGFIDDNKNERSLLFSEGGTNSVIYAIIVLMGLIVLIDWGRMRVIKSKK